MEKELQMNEVDASNYSKGLLIYRLIVCATGWISLIITMVLNYQAVLDGIDAIVLYSYTFSYYTIQSNLIVAIWLTFAIIYHNKEEKPRFLKSPVQGAITLYITVTFMIFAILLSWLYKPTGWAAVTNLTMHYLIPIAFIVDWIVTGNKTEYQWKYALYWLVYPLGYLIYTMIHGLFTNFYPYYFIDLSVLSIPEFIISAVGLSAVFLLLGLLDVFINRVLYRKRN